MYVAYGNVAKRGEKMQMSLFRVQYVRLNSIEYVSNLVPDLL